MPVYRGSPGYNALEIDAMLVTCNCHSREHAVHFSYWPQDEWPELFFQFHLGTCHNILKRLWIGLRYALGYRCRYGEWDELTIDPRDARELAEFLVEYAEIASTQRAASLYHMRKPEGPTEHIEKPAETVPQRPARKSGITTATVRGKSK